jgi:hypothetical protein
MTGDDFDRLAADAAQHRPQGTRQEKSMEPADWKPPETGLQVSVNVTLLFEQSSVTPPQSACAWASRLFATAFSEPLQLAAV